MSTELIYHTPDSMTGGVSPFDSAITEMVDGNDIFIACPYLGFDYLQRIILLAKNWKLLTDFEAWLSSHAQQSRSRIVDFALANPDQIRHCKNLHAKVIIAGRKALRFSEFYRARNYEAS